MSFGSTSAFEDEEDKFCLLELEDDFESLQIPELEDDVGASCFAELELSISSSGTSFFVGLLLSSPQLTKRKIADKRTVTLVKFFILGNLSN